VGVYPARNALTVYSDRAAESRLSRCAGLLVGYGLVDLDSIARGVRVLATVYREMTRPAAGRSRASVSAPRSAAKSAV
jgi:hypothetical protein